MLVSSNKYVSEAKAFYGILSVASGNTADAILEVINDFSRKTSAIFKANNTRLVYNAIDGLKTFGSNIYVL